MSEMMRGAWYERFGPAAEVISTGELEAPQPQAGEVRVRIAVSGVNPVDVKRRLGGRGASDGSRVVPHFDGAGTIESVGYGVPESRLGERVWVYEAQFERAFGTAAELAVVASDLAVPLPEGADLDAGACLGIPALTAHRCVFADGSVAGQTVLVTGGAGAVGNYAVQFAKLDGASVIATVSGDDKADLARQAGADHVVNYRTEDVAARLVELAGESGLDRVVEVEFGGNLEASMAALRNNGVIATYASQANPEPTVPFYVLVYKNITVQHVLVFGMPADAKKQGVDDISRWLEADQLQHHLGPRFGLDQIVAAHEAVEGGVFGKVLVDL
ncbi:MAG TPA: NADPH:quinone reductase [Acidobacteriota bacterium]|nr:NADPH:quinone reductase [Acidobacteriota bacterium]